MLPRTGEAVTRYRRRLRQRECELILGHVTHRFPWLRGLHGGTGPRILEFGAGQGHQAPLLQSLGRYVGSDIYISPRLKPDLDFIVCDIARTPFADRTFDLIYSNHVLEHVAALDAALAEVQRIGTANCIYAFSMPTPLWLFLWLPARYADKARHLLRQTGPRAAQAFADGESAEDAVRTEIEAHLRRGPPAPAGSPRRRVWATLCPGGHGEYPRFWQAVRAFAARRWRARFLRHGFSVAAEIPLLLYATARWPIIPANRLGPRVGLASSRLYLLQRTGLNPP
jgi:SAM-dependent methyltransferase